MINQIEKNVKTNVLSYLEKKLIIPLFEMYFDEHNCCNNDYFRLFTEDLANVFNECLPNYFENDYSKRIGQYYYSSLYGEPVEEDALMEMITVEDHENFRGVNVIFERLDSTETEIEESLENMTLDFNSIMDLIIIMHLKELNKLSGF